ncbi:MAG: hypothetical protein IPM98_14045 [Lewinellaceae bacterium]|nr:hypothetical protein [Lewinellaceae bacterium]
MGEQLPLVREVVNLMTANDHFELLVFQRQHTTIRRAMPAAVASYPSAITTR